MLPPKRDDAMMADALMEKVLAQSHEPPCKHVFAVFVTSAAVVVILGILLSLLAWTANRTLSEYDTRMQEFAKIDLSRESVIATMRNMLETQQQQLADQKATLSANHDAVMSIKFSVEKLEYSMKHLTLAPLTIP
jgi:predicted PurR-regulated permease PerM